MKKKQIVINIMKLFIVFRYFFKKQLRFFNIKLN